MARVWPTWVEQIIPRGTPGVVEQRLAVPWLSQVDSVTAPDANDCGPAAVAMALRYLGARLNMPTLATVTPKDVNTRISGGQDGTDTADLVNAFKAYGIDAAPSFSMTAETIQAVLASGIPPVVLVQRSKLPELTSRAVFDEAHWLVVTGYGPGTFTVNDALVPNGQDIAVAASNLQQALAGSSFLGKVNSPFLGVIAEPGVLPPVAVTPDPTPTPDPVVVTPPPAPAEPGLLAGNLTTDEQRQLIAAKTAEHRALLAAAEAVAAQIAIYQRALERAATA